VTQLLLTNGFRLWYNPPVGDSSVRDSHPLAHAHAGRTQGSRADRYGRPLTAARYARENQSMKNLGESFDKVADEYNRYRTGYDPRMIADIKWISGLSRSSAVCEIGAGTGQASVDFAPDVSRLVSIEPGSSLVDILQKNLSSYNNVQILKSTFEDAPLPGISFNLVFGAQSFHWVDSKFRYKKSFEILIPGGWLCAFWKHWIPTGEESGLASQRLLQEYLPQYVVPTPQQYEADVLLDLTEMFGSNLFSRCQLRRYPAPSVQDTRPIDERTESLRTWSMVAALEKRKQDQLISRLKDIYRGEASAISQHETVLVMGQKQVG
jgi:ubiquinone/menaquinone biosynthesis C-methylase UbiE